MVNDSSVAYIFIFLNVCKFRVSVEPNCFCFRELHFWFIHYLWLNHNMSNLWNNFYNEERFVSQPSNEEILTYWIAVFAYLVDVSAMTISHISDEFKVLQILLFNFTYLLRHFWKKRSLEAIFACIGVSQDLAMIWIKFMMTSN